MISEQERTLGSYEATEQEEEEHSNVLHDEEQENNTFNRPIIPLRRKRNGEINNLSQNIPDFSNHDSINSGFLSKRLRTSSPRHSNTVTTTQSHSSTSSILWSHTGQNKKCRYKTAPPSSLILSPIPLRVRKNPYGGLNGAASNGSFLDGNTADFGAEPSNFGVVAEPYPSFDFLCEESIFLAHVIVLEKLGVLESHAVELSVLEKLALEVLAARTKFLPSDSTKNVFSLCSWGRIKRKLLQERLKSASLRAVSQFAKMANVNPARVHLAFLKNEIPYAVYTELPILRNTYLVISRRKIVDVTEEKSESNRMTQRSLQLLDGTKVVFSENTVVAVPLFCVPRTLLSYPTYPLEGMHRFFRLTF